MSKSTPRSGPSQRPTSWWLSMLRRRAERMYEEKLDLSKPTIKHHLALLRAAGLVTITESGTVIYYSLRRNRLDDASADIKRFLVG